MSSLTFAQPPTEVKKPSSSSSIVKCFLLSSLNCFCLLFGLCAHVTLVLVFRVRCKCALCATLSGVLSNQPTVRPPKPITPSNNLALQHLHNLPATSLKRSSLQSITYKHLMTSKSSSPSSMSLPLSSQRSMSPRTSIEPSMPPPSSTLRSMQPPSGSLRSMQPPSGSLRSMQPPSGSLRNMQPPSGSLRSMQPPSGSLRCMQPPSGTLRSMQPPSSALRSMQMFTSFECRTQSLLAMEGSIQSLAKAEHITRPSNASCRLPQRNAQSDLAEVAVMFQPPYAVQDVVDADLKCAMLTIIDRMCSHDLFHRQCVALHHYREKQSTVTKQPADLVTKPVWGPQQSDSQHTYPWILPDKVSELDEQLDSQMRNLWSAPPAFGLPEVEILNIDAGERARGASLPALPTSMCWYTREMQSTVRQVLEQSAQSISTTDIVDSTLQTDLPAPVQQGAFAEPTNSTYSESPAEEAAASQGVTTQSELESFVAFVPSFHSRGSISSVASETISAPSPAATDIVQSLKAVVMPENVQSEVMSENTQLELPTLPMRNKLTALQERQEMQQRQLQVMREKRALKKMKRKKEKKRKQQLQLKHLQQTVRDDEDGLQLHKLLEVLE